ncbi:large ribosomal subunit protein uL14-like [Meriones unguiculatus]|uniref:large ribosomal subunit protein uL14-like n=1 Tax=Meriones unguiculatus TaxID=10047 RepID=UPI000B4EF2B7|nr:large ribosomal subunit protein uL14-like [Meriones unguiculatus]
MEKPGYGGSSGVEFQISRRLPVEAVFNCADNTGAKNSFIISVKEFNGWLNILPDAGVSDTVISTVKKDKPSWRGKPELRKKRKSHGRKDGCDLYLEDNNKVNNKGEMKGSAITGSFAKECADL